MSIELVNANYTLSDFTLLQGDAYAEFFESNIAGPWGGDEPVEGYVAFAFGDADAVIEGTPDEIRALLDTMLQVLDKAFPEE
jgi:hypothetical protein